MAELDYLSALNPEQKAFIQKFNQEFHAGSVKKGDANALHKTQQLQKSCWANNNAVNRDLYSISECAGLIAHEEFLGQWELIQSPFSENDLIDEIDSRMPDFL